MDDLKYRVWIRGIGYAEVIFNVGFLFLCVPYLLGFSFYSEARSDLEQIIGTNLGLEGWLYWVVFAFAVFISSGLWLSFRLIEATNMDTNVMTARHCAFVWKVYIVLGISICVFNLLCQFNSETLIFLVVLLIPKLVFVSMYINELDEYIDNGLGLVKIGELKF